MSKPMIGTKVAVLVAGGFDQTHLTAIQRALIEAGAAVRLVSPDQGLVNGWDGENWGHNFAVDATLNTALGVDYGCLVVPGGRRSLEKLKLTAHTRRFIGSFMAAMKPVAVMGDAVNLMAMSEQLAGRTVAGATECQEAAEKAGAEWSKDVVCVDGALMTGSCEADTLKAYVEALIEHFVHSSMMDQQAA